MVGFEGRSQGRIRDFVESVVVGGKDGHFGLEGEVGIDVAIRSQQGGELAEVLVRLQELCEILGALLRKGDGTESDKSNESRRKTETHSQLSGSDSWRNGSNGGESDDTKQDQQKEIMGVAEYTRQKRVR